MSENEDVDIVKLKARISELENEVSYLRRKHAPSDEERYDVGAEVEFLYMKAEPPEEGYEDDSETVSITISAVGNFGTPSEMLCDYVVMALMNADDWRVPHESDEIPDGLKECISQKISYASAKKLLQD